MNSDPTEGALCTSVGLSVSAMARAPHSSIFASLDLVVERAAWNGLRIVDVDAEVDALLRQFAEFRPNKDELRLELAHLATTHGITIRMGAS